MRRDLAAWLAKWQGKYAKLCAWVEENIEEALTYYRLPLAHHKHMCQWRLHSPQIGRLKFPQSDAPRCS